MDSQIAQISSIIEKALKTETAPERLFSLGLLCLMAKLLPEANRVFKHVVKICPKDPLYRSFLGLTLAIVENESARGLQLCRSAVQHDYLQPERDYLQPEVYCNLGKVYMLVGQRDKAYKAFKTGLFIDGDNEYLKGELKKMGIRKPAIFPFLKRSHSINCFAGKLCSMFTQKKFSHSYYRDNSSKVSLLSLYDLLHNNEKTLWSHLTCRNPDSLEKIWLLHV